LKFKNTRKNSGRQPLHESFNSCIKGLIRPEPALGTSVKIRTFLKNPLHKIGSGTAHPEQELPKKTDRVGNRTLSVRTLI
jgi:hypothetical protein